MINIKKLSALIILFILLIGIFLVSRKNEVLFFDQQSVLKEIKQLARLETASFTFEKIIEATKGTSSFSEFLFGDKILLVASAEIIAGFDFSRLEAKDVVVNGDVVTISLPSPEIFFVKLNNDKTRVYDRKVGLLVRTDKNLESEARKKAEEVILKDACKSDILEIAQFNGEKIIKTLFTSLGFKEVVINPSQGNCLDH